MAQPTPSLTLSVGERVVYPNQGVCRVTGIEAKEVAGQRLTFVTMEREEDRARVMVPQEKVERIGIRHLANREDVDKVFAFLRSESDKADLDWKQRARTNQDRMTQGGLLGLAEVVKALQVLSELRPLPTKERELYDSARHLLVTEVAAGLSAPEVDAEDAIDLVLFPPGKERPKRTAEEFKPTPGEGEEELGDLDSELLTMGGEELPPEPLPEDSESTEVIGRPLSEEGAEETTVDDEVTQPAASAAAVPAKRKRGRPPKPKPAVDPNAPPPAPKKRGRPPKPKPAVDPNAPPPAPKKRGRPPKSAAGEKKSK